MAYMNIFRIKSMEPRCLDGSAWLRIEGDEDQLSLHVDHRLAEMLADAFAKYKAMGTQDAAEGEALGAKCDAMAAQDAARALK